jgi:hypothetical protein
MNRMVVYVTVQAIERNQMEKRQIILRQIAQRLRDISEEIEQKQLDTSYFTIMNQHFVTIFYFAIYSFTSY